MRKLNIGCGSASEKGWINLDLRPCCPEVIGCDVTKGLPFATGSVDVCYSSHVLEHLCREHAGTFVEEQRRVLRPGGIVRVVVPDLEAICRNYVRFLEELLAGRKEHEFRYDYSMLELHDQMTREQSGGELGAVWASVSNPDDVAFVIERHGKVAGQVILSLRRQASSSQQATREKRGLRKMLYVIRCALAELAVKLLLGQVNLAAFRQGLFRSSGEIHRAMYDRYCLARLLAAHGFKEIRSCKASESHIPGFAGSQLEVLDGAVRLPDSLYMEAVRP